VIGLVLWLVVFKKKEDPFDFAETYEIETERATMPFDEQREKPDESGDEFFRPDGDVTGLMTGFDFSDVFGHDMGEGPVLYG
jgi:hypothetical protein